MYFLSIYLKGNVFIIDLKALNYLKWYWYEINYNDYILEVYIFIKLYNYYRLLKFRFELTICGKSKIRKMVKL